MLKPMLTRTDTRAPREEAGASDQQGELRMVEYRQLHGFQRRS